MVVMRINLACSLILSFVSIFAKHVSSEALPVWAKIREQCPEAGNKTAWMMAASKLDCLHSGDSRLPSEQKRVYHCLPSNLLNEYVEFCGINAPVEPGYCPVFKYINTNGRNRGPSYMNCSSFQSGCPEYQYFSRNVHKYPECLAINKNYRCYAADLSCPKVVNVHVSRENATILMDVLTSSISSTTDTVVKSNSDEMADTNDEWIKPLLIPLACFGFVLMCICVCVFVKRWRRSRVFKGKGIDAETLLKEMSERDEDQSHDEETPFIVRQEISGVPLKKLLYKITNTLGRSDVEKLQKFLQLSDGEDSEDKNTKIRNMDKFELLDYMDKIFHFDLNIYILQGFMENIGKRKLAENCTKFAKNSNNPLSYYVRERNFIGVTKIFVKLAREIDNYSRQEAETLVKELQHLLNARRDQIILYGLSEGCILLHLAVKDTLIPTLRTSDLHRLQKYKVFKISILEECIYYCYDVDLQHQCNSKGNYSFYPSKDPSTFYTSLTQGKLMKVEKEKGREMYEVGALETMANESMNIKRYLISSEECFREQQMTEKIVSDGEDLGNIYMDNTFHFDLNRYILQGFLKNIWTRKLAENSNNPLNNYILEQYFRGLTKIFVKLARDIKNFSRKDVDTIVKEFQHLLNASPGQIICYGLSEGCILLHLAVQDTLIPKLRTSDLHRLEKCKVFKISILEECIYYDVDLQHQCHPKGNYALYPFKDLSKSDTSLRKGELMEIEKERAPLINPLTFI